MEKVEEMFKNPFANKKIMGQCDCKVNKPLDYTVKVK
jgi:hypothetical protein